MTYYALLKRLQKMTPKQLRQKVKFKEGCSDNVTEPYGVFVARKDEYREDLVENEGGKEAEDGTQHHWVTDHTDLMFKKGQIWLLHDH